MIKQIIFQLLDSFDDTFDCSQCPLSYYCNENYGIVHGCSKVLAKFFFRCFK